MEPTREMVAAGLKVLHLSGRFPVNYSTKPSDWVLVERIFRAMSQAGSGVVTPAPEAKTSPPLGDSDA